MNTVKRSIVKELGAYTLAADIGGSHISAALVDNQDGTLLPHTLQRVPVDPHGSAEEILSSWTTLLLSVKKSVPEPLSSLGVAMPGPFDYAQGISLIKGMNKYEALYGWDIKQAFSHALDIPPACIGFVNDAEAFLRGEVAFLDARKDTVFMGITLGTGLGSARADGGKVVDLNLGSAPYLDGISEDYLSTRGLLAHYQQLGGQNARDIWSMSQLVDSEPAARATFRQLGAWLADFLIMHLPTVGAHYIILGGNITKAHPHFLPFLLQKTTILLPNIHIALAKTGEEAALLGASRYIQDTLTTR